MPRLLPTFTAIVVIGVGIAFNTARYPIVWKMVGPEFPSPTTSSTSCNIVANSSKAAASVEVSAKDTSIKDAGKSVAPKHALAEKSKKKPANTATKGNPSLANDSPKNEPSPKPLAALPAEKKEETKTTPATSQPEEMQKGLVENVTPIVLPEDSPKDLPVMLPKEERAATETVVEPVGGIREVKDFSNPEDRLSNSPRRLTPVSRDGFASPPPGLCLGDVRRLPPLEAEIIVPAGRYAGEYPSSAIPIYPTTGK